jgi:hypothetical protein
MQAQGARLIQSTPGLAEKLASSGKAHARTAAGLRDDKDTIIQDLQKQLDLEKSKNSGLEDQFKYRLAHFVKRETQTKNKIESLEKRLNEGMEQDEHMRRRSFIDQMHKTVIMGLDQIQSKTAQVLQDQEKDLMKAFRGRLQEVSKELEATRKGKGEAGTELQMRHLRVKAELKEAQDLAQNFDKKNQQLDADNKKLMEKLRTREDDRQCLLRELVISKKENARLKAQVKDAAVTCSTRGDEEDKMGKHASDSNRQFNPRQRDPAKILQTSNRQYEREVRYRDAVAKLKKMVDAEKKIGRSIRQQMADLVAERTEIEVLLRQCLDDVKAEVARHRMESDDKMPGVSGVDTPITAMSVHELTTQDRERVQELLLSQQRVVQLVYSKTFPYQTPSPAGVDGPSMSPMPQKASNEDDFSWLGDILPSET